MKKTLIAAGTLVALSASPVLANSTTTLACFKTVVVPAAYSTRTELVVPASEEYIWYANGTGKLVRHNEVWREYKTETRASYEKLVRVKCHY
jgi:hypothetical protein